MSVLIFIGVLLLLIIGHEFGHFVVAKLSGMRVDEFGVGFPPKIWGKRFGGGETEYTINWLPFGGFVRIFGESGEEGGSDPRAFANRPKFLQAAVLFAGPFANIVLAFVLSASAFMFGTQTVIDETNSAYLSGAPSVLVGAVLPGSPAERAGIKAGDTVYAVTTQEGAVSIETPEAVSAHIASSVGPVTVTVLREGSEHEIVVTPVKGLVESDPARSAIGIATALVGKVLYPAPVALLKAAAKTADDVVYVTTSLAHLIASAFTFSADLSSVAGPVGIASLTGSAAAFGFGSLLSFAALLSINLGIINLLPFPALDGGRLVLLFIEVVSGRKIPERFTHIFNSVGFAVLILLMVAVTIGDVGRLLG